MKLSKPGDCGSAPANQVSASQALYAAALLALGDEIARQLEELAQGEPAAGGMGLVPPVTPMPPVTLMQVGGALRFAGVQAGAVLVELLATALQRQTGGPVAPADMTTKLKVIAADCAACLRDALRSSALGQPLAIAHWLPCWQRLAALVPDADTHLCQLLSLAPNPDLAVLKEEGVPPDTSDLQVAIDLLVCEVDRALLDFLRSDDDSMRQYAAKTMAVALAGIAARQASPQDRLRWHVLEAFALEVSAGQSCELTRTKRILSVAARQVRQVQRLLHHVPPDSLLREALFEIMQHPCLTALAQQIAKVYALASQFSLLAGPGSVPLADDEVFECDWTALQKALQATMGMTDGWATTAASSSTHDRSVTDLAAGCRTGPDLPSASGLMRAIVDAIQETVAAIEHQIDADGEQGLSLGAFDDVQGHVSQIDACIAMLDHTHLRGAADELNAALEQLSPVVSVGGDAADYGERLAGFAASLAALEAALALLPFSSSANDTGTRAGEPTLQQIFMNEACVRLDSLSASLATWKATPAAGLPLQACIDAHAIAGSSATVGWVAIHRLAQPLERACAACEARTFATDAAGVLADAIAGIRFLLDAGIGIAAADGGPCADSQLIARLQAMAQPPTVETVCVQATEPSAIAEEPTDAPDIELRALFDEEAADLLPQLHHAMQTWLSRPEGAAPPAHLMRVLHTLKGSARMAGQTALGNALHHIESEVAAIVDARSASAETLQQLQRKLDDALQFTDMHCEPVPSIASLDVNGEAALPAISSAPAVSALPARAENMEGGCVASSTGSSTTVGPSPSPGPSPSQLRIPVSLLGRMTDAAAGLLSGLHQQGDELLALRQGVTELADNLSRLRTQLREMEIEADTRIDARALRHDDAAFDPLEFDRYTRVHELTRAMSESVADIAEVQRMVARQSDALAWSSSLRQRQARALHADLLQAGTSPFGSLEPRLLQALRQAVRDMGGRVDAGEAPEARLVLEGGELALDRSLLERLAAPLEHLVRNAIAHGIESAAERERLGKPRIGTLRLLLSREANQWRLEAADDGRGLDAARLCARAAAMGLAVPAGLPDGDDAAAAELIFVRGLSTSDALTPLAGRGVGMDAVRAAVQSLGGAIGVRSEPGRGCCFVIVLPLTLAILPVLVCRAGSHLIGVPSAMVEQVLKLDGPAFAAATEGEGFAWQGQACRWRMLATLLGTQPAANSGAARRKTVLLLSQAGSRLALVVDAVDARRELSLRDPGLQLLSVPGMIAASPAADGRVVLVMNPFSLAHAGHLPLAAQASALPAACMSAACVSAAYMSAAAMSATASAGDTAPAVPPPVQAPVILVVDDSLTVRRATQRLLERQGYTVLLARDGTEALALLAGTAGDSENDVDVDTRTPQAVLLDIEMPKMDGFDLLSVLRDDARWQHLPVVMITSRTADRHRERALQLGANAYVGKPYREDELLDLLSGLTSSAPSSAPSPVLPPAPSLAPATSEAAAASEASVSIRTCAA